MSRRIDELSLFFILKIIMFSCSSICTMIERELEGKIVGGSYASISKFPHAAYLSIKCGKIKMICGSSIVNQQILLTAAHCIIDCDNFVDIDVYAGHENLEKVSILRKVAATVVHKYYSEHTLENDIALLSLTKALPLGKLIKRVIIKPFFKVKNDERTYVAGWGIVNDVTKEKTMLMKYVEQPLCPLEICRRIVYWYKGMLCAGDHKDDKNRPTRGDSGSALITSQHQQIGIVSFRNDNYPGLIVYSNVSYYFQWIKNTSEKMYCWHKKKDYILLVKM